MMSSNALVTKRVVVVVMLFVVGWFETQYVLYKLKESYLTHILQPVRRHKFAVSRIFALPC